MICSAHMISIKYALFVPLLITSILFTPLSSPAPVQAQEPCGNFIYGTGEDQYEYPVEDCNNPFGEMDTNPNLGAKFNEVQLEEGEEHPLFNVFGKFEATGLQEERHLFDVALALYKHSASDYVYIEGDLERYTFTEAGTYTLVVGEYDRPILSANIFERTLSFLVPTAYAFTPSIRAITFTIVEEVPAPTGPSSALFLPGIQASRLYKDGLLGSEDQVWEPNGNQDLRQLSMNESGVSDNDIYTRDIMEEIFGVSNVYAGFAHFMDDLVTDGVIQNWKPFAYDWRYSVVDVANNGTAYENQIKSAVAELEHLAEDSFSGKVTLIGHSNGGLLAKAIMHHLASENKTHLIDRVVFLATPQLGTPEAIGTILHGYDQAKFGGLLIDGTVARDVIGNMPGAYGLVPTQKYFNVGPGLKIFFDSSAPTQKFRTAYGNAINTEAELIEFMVGQTDTRVEAQTEYDASFANRALLETALAQHRTQLDTWVAPQGVEVVEVVGVGLNTVSGFEYRGFTERICSEADIFGHQTCESKEIYKPVPYISQYGDKTVIADSAEGYGGEKERYYVDLDASDTEGGVFGVEHLNFTENPSIQSLLKNILQNASTTDIRFISKTKSAFDTDKIILGSHSPVAMNVTDSSGRKVGVEYAGSNNVPLSREDIPGSSYFEIGGSTYIILPASLTYDVKLSGTGEGGLTFTLDTLHGELQEKQVSVAVATITASTTIKLSYTNETLSNLFIDTNTDGTIDIEMTPTGEVVVPVVTYTTLKTALNNLSLSKSRKSPLIALVVIAEAFDKKSVKYKSFEKLEQLTLSQLKQTLTLYIRKGWLTQDQVTPVIKLIDGL